MKHDPNFQVSVIIPAYNNGEYIVEALESVLNQTLAPFEIIVVDSSTDDTSKMIQQYRNDIKYVFQEKQGIGMARNLGIRMAKGNFFAHLDGDDLWEKEKLAMQKEIFAADSAMDIVGTYMESFLSPELAQNIQMTLYCPTSQIPAFSASAIVVKRDAFYRVGMYETHWKVGQDLNWFVRAREIGLKEGMVSQSLVRRRIHKTNTDQLNQQYKYERVRILKEALDRRRNNKNG